MIEETMMVEETEGFLGEGGLVVVNLRKGRREEAERLYRGVRI